jgi:phospholipid/cholesterol/gamma-HCH transport system substrate-binding protein
MEAEDIKQNTKLGTFVLVSVALFLISVIFIGSASNVFSKTFSISAIFKNIEGLKEGDKVWLSGVQIGTVKKVNIIKVGEVLVTLSLKEKQNEFIRRNATASIGSDGLVGNKIVVIRPGNAAQVIQDSDTINADSPLDTQQLISVAKDVGENTRTLTEDLKVISAKIRQGQGIVGDLLNDGTMSQDIRGAIHELKLTGENTTRASQQLSAVTNELRNGHGLLPTLVSDTAYTKEFTDVLANIREVSAHAKALSESLDSVTSKMKNHDNAVGVLLADTAVANELKKTVQNTQSASLKLDENMEALKHNFLTRGYFRKKEKQEAKEKAKAEKNK